MHHNYEEWPIFILRKIDDCFQIFIISCSEGGNKCLVLSGPAARTQNTDRIFYDGEKRIIHPAACRATATQNKVVKVSSVKFPHNRFCGFVKRPACKIICCLRCFWPTVLSNTPAYPRIPCQWTLLQEGRGKKPPRRAVKMVRGAAGLKTNRLFLLPC